eukprot:768289-Hanusia_phi.AAC.2
MELKKCGSQLLRTLESSGSVHNPLTTSSPFYQCKPLNCSRFTVTDLSCISCPFSRPDEANLT